jgi:hypothetical protein
MGMGLSAYNGTATATENYLLPSGRLLATRYPPQEAKLQLSTLLN